MSNKKILIIAPAWIGDLIISAALIKALKNNQDNSIDILTNSNLVNVAHLIPGLRKVIPSETEHGKLSLLYSCLLYTSPSPRDGLLSRMPSSA